ncbi:GyrI-like domain-containing protein [Dysgonomonas sp. 520]|uniref:AraC family transcriptional regulator n=1 Tax=Dysgonomonas sp. 520 TaxID=2302931 RepID=UPI0013D608C1|nr:AraC family transcriptional regulator [Dysgonomonas sp. 520]NDW09576.1 AraC family transcriptional regulator [Dysgonomonas sp. 520]
MEQKISTREEYQKRVNMIVEYINSHLDEELDLGSLAEKSNLSQWHFHRIMKAFLGESLGAFIMRTRVETAARLLRYTDMPIQDIAYKIGYDMPSSLSKVFKLFYGVSPTEIRNNKKFVIMKPIRLNEELNIKKPKIVELNPKKAIYISLIGEYSSLDFGGTWSRLWQYVKDNKLFSAGIEHICIYHNDPKITESDKLRTDICLVVQKPVEPKGEIGVKEIEGGKYAVFLYQGSYDHLSSVYDTIYEKWLPESGERLRDTACFEKYVNNPDNTAPEKLKTEIYIPIE